MELVERAGAPSLFELHARACRGELPTEPLVGTRSRRVLGKAIVFARRDVVVEALPGPLLPHAADLPHPGERVGRGHPICTLLAEAGDASACGRELAARARALYAALEPRSLPRRCRMSATCLGCGCGCDDLEVRGPQWPDRIASLLPVPSLRPGSAPGRCPIACSSAASRPKSTPALAAAAELLVGACAAARGARARSHLRGAARRRGAGRPAARDGGQRDFADRSRRHARRAASRPGRGHARRAPQSCRRAPVLGGGSHRAIPAVSRALRGGARRYARAGRTPGPHADLGQRGRGPRTSPGPTSSSSLDPGRGARRALGPARDGARQYPRRPAGAVAAGGGDRRAPAPGALRGRHPRRRAGPREPRPATAPTDCWRSRRR